MLWNVPSARDEISLRKWSAQLCTLEEHWLQKMRFVGSNALFSLMLVHTWHKPGLKDAARGNMWPAKVFRAARDPFWESTSN